MRLIALLSALLLPTFTQAANLDGASLSLAWGIPFALILLSIATGPLLFAHTWHHHFGKITALWTFLFLIPFAMVFGLNESIHLIAHALVGESIYFVVAGVVHDFGWNFGVGQFTWFSEVEYFTAGNWHFFSINYGNDWCGDVVNTSFAQSQ